MKKLLIATALIALSGCGSSGGSTAQTETSKQVTQQVNQIDEREGEICVLLSARGTSVNPSFSPEFYFIASSGAGEQKLEWQGDRAKGLIVKTYDNQVTMDFYSQGSFIDTQHYFISDENFLWFTYVYLDDGAELTSGIIESAGIIDIEDCEKAQF